MYVNRTICVPNHANRRTFVNHRIGLPNDCNSGISPEECHEATASVYTAAVAAAAVDDDDGGDDDD